MIPTLRSHRRTSTRRRRPVVVESLETRCLLSASVVGTPGAPTELRIDAEQHAADSVLVRFDAGVDTSAYEHLGTFEPFDAVPGLQRVSLAEGVSVDAALETFRVDAGIRYAEPDFDVFLEIVPDDTEFDSLWGMENVGQTGGVADADVDATAAWDTSTGSGSFVVAVIDTGVDYTHEDLADNVWVNPGEIPGNGVDDDGNGFVDDVHGFDFYNFDGDPMDDHDHGTHVAGTIGAIGDNGLGVTGVNWNVQIMAVKFLSATGGGSISDAIAAIDYAVQNGARISNNSWGFNGNYSQALDDAIAAARDAGHLFVAAAGNGDSAGNGIDNDTRAFWPANHDHDNVLAVAATDHADQLATFSNYGATTVDLGAPGVGILSTTVGGTYDTFSGTSMATPHAAGAAALLWDAHPEWSYQQVVDRLFETVDPIPALDGKTVTGGRLNAGAALGPDVTGPQVTGTLPDEFTFEAFDSFVIQFSEAVDPDSFTPSDVASFEGPLGPLGPIAVDSVSPVGGSSNRAFEVHFALQEELGPYRFELAPTVTDLAGNPLDQDRDRTGGEAEDAYFGGFDLVPFFANLDFGTSSSPVADDHQRVDPGTVYTAERGHGWTAGTIDTRDRGVGDDVERDFDFAAGSFSFALDVQSAPLQYEVTLVMGDGLTGTTPRDDIGIFAEGVHLDTVTTQPGEFLTTTHTVAVGDGRLDLELRDLGGSDAIVLLNGLQVRELGPDLVGPRVVSTSPSEETAGSIDRFVVTFDEAIDAATFTTADATVTGPSGDVPVTAIEPVSATEFAVVFDEQTELGDYALVVGPDVRDPAGNAMDQDGDRVNGEAGEDAFATSVELVPVQPFEARFDFGTASSPVALDHVRVAETTSHDAATGFGWTSGAIDSRDRGSTTGDDRERDFNHTSQGTFAVDVPQAGLYDVTVVMGDGLGYVRDEMGVFLEGTLFESITADGVTYETRTFRLRVDDGRLDAEFRDLGGSDPLVMINALEVVAVPADDAGPRVVSVTPTEPVEAPLESFTVVFDETIDAASFTPDDVTVTGPAGTVDVSAVEAISAFEFRVVLSGASEPGTYAVSISPDVRDVAGNPMNQDGDAVNGEADEDRFATAFDVIPVQPFEALFDFGTSSSPVAVDHLQVVNGTQFSSATGFGWTSGSINSRDRGSTTGDDRERDFNYTSQGTFAVDVADPGLYDVTVVMGDGLGYVRDEMGVFLEGTLFESITADGTAYETRTFRLRVDDGRLDVEFRDLGGNDPLVMINALEVVAVPSDDAGPRVIGITPEGEATTPFESFEIAFDETIDATTFTAGDVAVTGPDGAVGVLDVQAISASRFLVTLASQTTSGTYTIAVGPDVRDVAGNAMNQDADGTNGEPIDDAFTAELQVVTPDPFGLRLDFGTYSSPVAVDHEQVLSGTNYPNEGGFGWTSGAIYSRDRGASTGDDRERDFNYTTAGTFAVDVPEAGEYDVTVVMGDGLGYVRDEMGVFLEGTLFESITADGTEYAVRTFRVQVDDGRLDAEFRDLGGSNNLVMINALEVHAASTAGASAMRVSESEPSTTAFSETRDATAAEAIGVELSLGLAWRNPRDGSAVPPRRRAPVVERSAATEPALAPEVRGDRLPQGITQEERREDAVARRAFRVAADPEPATLDAVFSGPGRIAELLSGV